MEVSCASDPVRYAKEYKGFKFTGNSYVAFRDIHGLIRKYVKGKETLDYGCGPGISTVFLRSLGLNVKGVDISKHMIEYARENDVKGNYEVIISAKIPADDSTYDLVFASWVMDNIGDKSELKSIALEVDRVLKPNGIFIIMAVSKDAFNKDWLSYNAEYPENKTLYSGCHVKVLLKDNNMLIDGYFWAEEDYQEILEDANMTILEIHNPLGKDSDGYNWKLEKSLSPTKIYIAKKK